MDFNKDNQNTQPGSESKETQNPTPEVKTETTQEEPKKEGDQPKKISWQAVLTFIAIIAIIIIFVTPGGSKDSSDVVLDENGEEVVVEEGVLEDGEATSEPIIRTNSGSGIATQTMTPVQIGDDFNYKFEGIDWFLEDVDGGTAVKFKFSEFSRREGSIVAFGNPYRLGVFAGNCTEVDSMTYDNSSNTDTPLAYVSCRAENGEGSDVAIFQNGAKVYASQRNVADNKAGEFTEFFSRDITTIVR